MDYASILRNTREENEKTAFLIAVKLWNNSNLEKPADDVIKATLSNISNECLALYIFTNKQEVTR